MTWHHVELPFDQPAAKVPRLALLRILLPAALCGALASACGGAGPTPSPTPSPAAPNAVFLRTEGTRFSGGQRFLGLNLDPWRFMTNAGEVYSCDELRTWARLAREVAGARVLRMHMNGRAFEPTVGSYDEGAFRQLDCLLAAAAEQGQQTVVCLRDYLWAPWPPEADDPYWYLGGGTQMRPNKDAIITDAGGRRAFQAFVAYVLARRNTTNGVLYRDDPSILAWELINEPNLGAPGFGDWLVAMTAHTRSLDPNHLVSLGVGGVEQDWWDSSPASWSLFAPVDFLDLHYYADPSAYGPTPDAANLARLRRRLHSALALGKPVIVGEFGCLNTVPEDTVLRLYRTLIESTLAEGGAGALAYSWGPPGPHGWGGPGSFAFFAETGSVCSLMRSLAP
jgi:mannan endo-1,4-beta-mannosidase